MRHPTAPRTAAIRTAARRPAAGIPVLRTVTSRTAALTDVGVDAGVDTATEVAAEPVLAVLEILVARIEQLEVLARDAWRWSSTDRRQVVAAMDEVLEGLRVVRARLAAIDDDLPPRAG